MNIPGKFSIASPYGNLQDFFTRILGVAKPDIRMHVAALEKLGKGNCNATQIKDSIKRISNAAPSVEDLKVLKNANIFYVKNASGNIARTNSLADFAIADRPEYEEAFRGKLAVLEFSFEEIRSCRAFLEAMQLGRKYMSKQVTEKTEVDGGEIAPVLTSNLRKKAKALIR